MIAYWYFITVYYCPQCGRSRTYKDRRNGPKPIKWEDRHEEIEAWDYCD